jgi:hypothetical protein
LEAVLIQAINRLEGILAGETEALREGRVSDVGEASNRKNHSLLELSRISRGLDPAAVTPVLKERLGTLKHRLEENRRVLALHMGAAEEISGIIARTMKDAESDGTYAAPLSGAQRG